MRERTWIFGFNVQIPSINNLSLAVILMMTGMADVEAADDKIPILQSGAKIYEVSPAGKVRYDKPHKEVKNGKIYEVSPSGKVRYDKPSYVIKP